MLDQQFHKLNTKFQTVVQLHKNKLLEAGQHSREHMLPVSDSIFCAEDTMRNHKFFLWIHQAIQQLRKTYNEIIVVDAGSGSGILWLFALSLGADKCYFLEQNPLSLALSKEVLSVFRHQHQGEFVQCDATHYDMPEKFHLLISETLSSGFVEEDFISIISNLKNHQYNWAILLPSRFDLNILEKDRYWQTLTQQKILLETQNLENSKKIKIQHKDTHRLTFEMSASFPGNITISPSTCLSFLNPRDFQLDQKHPFFEIISPKQ